MAEKIIEKIKNHIKNQKNDLVFNAKDFTEIGQYEAVRKTLNRLTDKGELKKIAKGLYYCPRFSETLQEYEVASPHEIAMAIARKFNWNIAPSGATALNILGFSTQVPSKWSYISDGKTKQIKIDNNSIEFKHRDNREISGMSYKTALVIQGIKALGKDNIDEDSIKKLQGALTKEEKETMLKEAKSTFVWIYQVIEKICGGASGV